MQTTVIKSILYTPIQRNARRVLRMYGKVSKVLVAVEHRDSKGNHSEAFLNSTITLPCFFSFLEVGS